MGGEQRTQQVPPPPGGDSWTRAVYDALGEEPRHPQREGDGKVRQGGYLKKLAVIVSTVLLLIVVLGLLVNEDVDDMASPQGDSSTPAEPDESETEPSTNQPREPEVEVLAVPDVVGLTESEASDELTSAGFEVNSRTGISDEQHPGVVYRSDPAPGDEAEEGSSVKIFVVRDEPEPEPEISVVGLGDPVEYNDWSFRVRDVQVLTSIDRAAPPRGKYVAVMIEATNQGSAPRSFAGGLTPRPVLYDVADEREYEFDSSASLSHHHAYRDDTWHLEDIGPGFSAVMPIVFDIPEEIEIGLFVLADPNAISDPVRIEID